MRSAKQSRPSGHLRPIMHSRATIFSAGKFGQAVGGDICGSQTALVYGAVALEKAGVGRRGIRTVHMVMPAVCGVEPDGATDPILVNCAGLLWCVISPLCPLCDVHSKPMQRSHFADTCYVFSGSHTKRKSWLRARYRRAQRQVSFFFPLHARQRPHITCFNRSKFR